MGKIINSIKKVFGGEPKKSHKFLQVGKGWGQTTPNKVVDYKSFLKTGSGAVWSTFRSCDIVGNAIMQTSYKLINETSGNDVTADRTGIADLLKHPNPVDTFEDLMYLYAHHMKLTGNFFLLKDKINPVTGAPEELWPLIPSKVGIIPSETSMNGGIKEYTYTINNLEVTYKPDELIHFKRPHADNQYWGLGDIEAGTGLYNDFINRDQLNNEFQKNGGLPSGVLVNEEFEGDAGEWERVRAIWANQYAGKKNLGKIAWLTGKWNFIKLGLTAEQMQAIEKDRQNVNQIFLNHGVPLSIAGIEKAANYATSRQDYINFKRFTCYPLALNFFRKLNKDLISKFDENYKLDFTVSGLVDGEAIVREYLPFLSQGVITPNEIRDLAGLPKVDNPLLDSHYINTQLIPLEMVGLANSFGDVPNEILENQVENAGGDPSRIGEEIIAETEEDLSERMLRLRKP